MEGCPVSALSYQDFCFSHEGGMTVGPVSWEVPQGSFALLTGATGCGKTTLLRCAKPELAPVGARSGALSVLGEPLAQLPAATSAQAVGYVAQDVEGQLVCSTVWHQMALGLELQGVSQGAMRRRVAQTCHFLGMEGWFEADVNELSGGQQQLLNLASVLVTHPRLLLLDEPTAQLDPVAERDFCHALMRVNRELGLTVVVATHAPRSFAEYATSCVRLDGTGVHEVPLDALRHAATQLVEPRRPGPAGTQAPVVEARDVWFRYQRDAAAVLRGVNLQVRPATLHALVGGNGCGKSTLLRLAAGVHKPGRGTLRNRLKARQALLPQDPRALFVCDTVAEELGEWQRACGYGTPEVEAALERYGLAAHVQQHPYDLSGGQRQLLAFAKLMLTKPALLLADEPTKGLDGGAKALVEEALTRAVGEGVTVLLATHDLALVARCTDAVTLLFDGQDACTEPPASFFAESLFFRAVDDGPVCP